MSTSCQAASLATDLVKNCTDPVLAGIEKISRIMNRADVDIQATKATKVSGSNNLYESLVIKPTKRGYKVTNTINSVTTKVDGTYDNVFQKVVTGVLLDDGDVPSAMIEALGSKDGEFIMVIEHKFKDFGRSANPGSSAFEIIGIENPLTSNGQAIVNDKSADTRGGWAFGLACEEIKPRYYWMDSTYPATKLLFDALETPAT